MTSRGWPSQAFLVSHANKWGRGRRAGDYAQWAYDIKQRAGVHILAYVHAVHLNRGLAFVDHRDEAIVQFDIDQNLNFDCISPPNGTRAWVTEKTTLGTHWRVRQAER